MQTDQKCWIKVKHFGNRSEGLPNNKLIYIVQTCFSCVFRFLSLLSLHPSLFFLKPQISEHSR